MKVNDLELNSFLKLHFDPKNLDRIKTFEKFAFNCVEKDDNLLEDNLSKIRGRDPKTTCNTIDLWSEKDKIMLQKMTNFEHDKESLK